MTTLDAARLEQRALTISVLIPCHNYGRFIGEALASLDAQERRPEQIIICDDGSTDNSWEIISGIIRGRVDTVAYRHERAQGVVATLNEMAARSDGDVIVPFSADDRLGSTYLARMEESLVANDWAFAYSDYLCFGAEDRFVTVPEFEPDLLSTGNYIAGTAAIRRTLFDAIGGYRSEFARFGFEDYDFWLSAVEAGATGGRAAGCVLEWRRHEGGSRNTTNRRRRIMLRLKLVRHHPRFFLRWRTVGQVVREIGARGARRRA